jgi:peptidoglycan/xylan/chitin deacetylase (PgdA/CDA1 family)
MFKRFLVMAGGIVFFVAAFLYRFHLVDTDIEKEFKQERVTYDVEGRTLTSTTPPPPVPSLPATPTVVPPAPTDQAPETAPTPAPDASAPAAPDTNNVIIGPMPPSAAPASPAVPATDTNAAPAAPASTQVLPRFAHLPFVLIAEAIGSNGVPITQPTPAQPATGTPPATATIVGPNGSLTETNTAVSPMITTGTTNMVANAPVRPAPVGASVIVLGFHQFTGPGQSSSNIYSMKQEVFASEMKYLHDNGYRVIPLNDVVRFIHHEIGVPPNAVAITIDDGYKSAINWAAPVLKQYGYPWTYFVYPDFITVNEGKGAASWNDLLQLQAEGVDIESHSMTHPQLTKHTQKWPYPKGTRHLLTPDEYAAFLKNETAGAKAVLEQHLGRPVRFLAYPYGDYNKQVEAAAIAAGYEAIFTVANNPVHESTNVFSIGRYIITKPVERAFAAYLREGALGLVDVSPAPGTTITDPRPTITATLGYVGTIDPNSIDTDVRDFGTVKHDYDPRTGTVRLYLPRDLIQPTVVVNIHARDAATGQMMVANWHFNYEPGVPGAVHPPITGATNGPPQMPMPVVESTNAAPAAAARTPGNPSVSTNDMGAPVH